MLSVNKSVPPCGRQEQLQYLQERRAAAPSDRAE